MKVIRPIQITPDKIISSTAGESYADWNSTTSYILGMKVVFNNSIYESLIENNLNKNPQITPTVWLYVGASNKTAMFDLEVNSQTTAGTILTVKFRPGKPFDIVSFLNIKGKSISVTVKDGGGVIVYNSSIDLVNLESIIDWYTYFFEDFDLRTEAVFQNIPPYLSDSTIEVTIQNNPGQNVAIGNCCIGTTVDLGDTQYGLNYGIRDYSVKETDEFGNTKFVQRAYSKRISSNLMVANTRLNYVSRTLESLRATPTVYIAVDDPKYGGTVIFGFLKDWNIEISYPNHSMISMEVDGLI